MNLKTYRIKFTKTKGCSQAEKIAKKLNITVRTYYNYEKGVTEPDLTTLIKLADYFCVSLDELLDRNFNKGLTENQIAINKIYEQLPNHQQAQVIEYANIILENYKLQKEKELNKNIKHKK